MPKLVDRLARAIYQRYFEWRLPALVAPAYPVILEYPITPQPRYGYGKPPHPELHALIEAGRADYAARLREFTAVEPLARAIAQRQAGGNAAGSDAIEPDFFNTYFHGLDAIALLGFLRSLRPPLMLEIGSGNSTRFARRAIREYGLPTRIVSCDPQPRAEIAAVADEIIRAPAETLPPETFERLEPGDLLFIDSSHRVFQNSDVAMLFLEVLPRLKRGVVVHVHDILLPYDYQPEWADRHYSEQYLLAAWLLANPRKFTILLPNAFIGFDAALREATAPLWADPALARARAHAETRAYGLLGYSFWLRVNEAQP